MKPLSAFLPTCLYTLSKVFYWGVWCLILLPTILLIMNSCVGPDWFGLALGFAILVGTYWVYKLYGRFQRTLPDEDTHKALVFWTSSAVFSICVLLFLWIKPYQRFWHIFSFHTRGQAIYNLFHILLIGFALCSTLKSNTRCARLFQFSWYVLTTIGVFYLMHSIDYTFDPS